MGRKARVLVSLLAVFLIAVTGTQVLTRGYVFSNIGTLFSWSGSSQAWSGSTQNLTCADWALIHNDGTTCGTSSTNIVNSFAISHAVNTSPTHTPILANNTWRLGGFGSWTSSNTGGCSGSPFSGNNVSGDEDADSGLASASSLNCAGAVLTLVQNFSTGGVPTSQTYSFWYNGNASVIGDPVNCTQGTGTVSLTLVINATTVATISSPTLDGNWHSVSGSTTAIVNGSNTFTINATLSAASGQISTFNPKSGLFICHNASRAQAISIDNAVLTANW